MSLTQYYNPFFHPPLLPFHSKTRSAGHYLSFYGNFLYPYFSPRLPFLQKFFLPNSTFLLLLFRLIVFHHFILFFYIYSPHLISSISFSFLFPSFFFPRHLTTNLLPGSSLPPFIRSALPASLPPPSHPSHRIAFRLLKRNAIS